MSKTEWCVCGIFTFMSHDPQKWIFSYYDYNYYLVVESSVDNFCVACYSAIILQVESNLHFSRFGVFNFYQTV